MKLLIKLFEDVLKSIVIFRLIIKMSLRKFLFLFFLSWILVIPGESVMASAIPALIDFNSDMLGQPPATDGINQPCSYTPQSSNVSILVQSGANGINTQPVVLSSTEKPQAMLVDYFFDPVDLGTLRAEATISFDRFAAGYILQTSSSYLQAVISRPTVQVDGTIVANGQNGTMTIGNYAPDQPFRIRTDINMNNKTWSATIDNELNGFADDPVFENLRFTTSDWWINDIFGVHASFVPDYVMDLDSPIAVAYDDISISVVPEPSSFLLLASGLLVMAGMKPR